MFRLQSFTSHSNAQITVLYARLRIIPGILVIAMWEFLSLNLICRYANLNQALVVVNLARRSVWSWRVSLSAVFLLETQAVHRFLHKILSPIHSSSHLRIMDATLPSKRTFRAQHSNFDCSLRPYLSRYFESCLWRVGAVSAYTARWWIRNVHRIASKQLISNTLGVAQRKRLGQPDPKLCICTYTWHKGCHSALSRS